MSNIYFVFYPFSIPDSSGLTAVMRRRKELRAAELISLVDGYKIINAIFYTVLHYSSSTTFDWFDVDPELLINIQDLNSGTGFYPKILTCFYTSLVVNKDFRCEVVYRACMLVWVRYVGITFSN